MAVATTAASTASPNLNDQAILATDLLFLGRVSQALAYECTSIMNEPITASNLKLHQQRASRAALITQSLGSTIPITSNPYVRGFGIAVATNGAVLNDATQNGSVPLTSANVDTQQALIADADITAAVAANFNTFFDPLQ